MRKVNNTLLNNQWIKEITKEVSKYFEMNEGNTLPMEHSHYKQCISARGVQSLHSFTLVEDCHIRLYVSLLHS